MIERLKKNNAIRSVYSWIPERFQKGYTTFNKCRKLIRETEYLSKKELEDFQFCHLKKIVNYAWENVEGYRILWENAFFEPKKLKKIEDIQLIPFVTKSMLRDNIKKFTNQSIVRKKLLTTGGSTGIPFGFYNQQKNVHIEKSFIYDMWARHYPSISTKCKSFVLRGAKVDGFYEHDPRVGIILSSYNITSKSVHEYVKLIERYRYPIFQAYPSSIYFMAKIMKEENIKLRHKFSSIMLGSEPLYAFQRKLIKDVFKTDLCFWYGATEQTVLAGNCEHDSRFHVYPQYGIAEIVNSKGMRVFNEGDAGEIIGTSFWNFATPFIRYKTMDYAELGAEKCEVCGRNYQLFNKIEGRLQDFIVDKESHLIPLTALIFAQHFEAFSRIKRMSLYQDRVGTVEVKIIPAGDFDIKDEQEIVQTMTCAVDGRINVVIKKVHEVLLTNRGKLKFLDQKLNINKFICNE